MNKYTNDKIVKNQIFIKLNFTKINKLKNLPIFKSKRNETMYKKFS